MFYSQCLLSEKGPLAAIWVAAYCFRRLKKRQVTDTHIPSSVDKILLEGLDAVTYRILGYLLLGVVRIYSRKVEYLFQDCHGTVSDINRFSVGKKVIPFRDLVRSSNSIILPERYELDAFQVEVADGASSGHIARNEEITLQDARADIPGPCLSDKNPYVMEVSPDLPETFDAQTQKETLSPAQTPEKVTTDREASTNACTPPDTVLSLHQMDNDTEVSSPANIKTFETSKEKLRESRITQQDVDTDMICGLDIELINLINEFQEQKGGDGDADTLEKADLEKDDVILKDKEMPPTAEKTPNSEVLDTAGAAGLELLAVPTPAKESLRRTCKRKCVIDKALVLNNQVMKHTIDDASDLVCKRRKAPHTVIDIWRFSRIPTLSKNFSEPLIPFSALEMQHVYCSRERENTTPSSSSAAQPDQTIEAVGKSHNEVCPKSPADSRSAIAPGTPVLCSTSARVFASPRTADSDGEGPVHLNENSRREFPGHEEEEDNSPILMDEMDANEGDSQELRKEKNGISTRTRTVAKHLHEVMHKKKQQGEKPVSLLPILKRRSKAENARFFFEVQVLSSGGYVKVTQEKPYEDISLQETPKMEEALRSC